MNDEATTRALVSCGTTVLPIQPLLSACSILGLSMLLPRQQVSWTFSVSTKAAGLVMVRNAEFVRLFARSSDKYEFEWWQIVTDTIIC